MYLLDNYIRIVAFLIHRERERQRGTYIETERETNREGDRQTNRSK